jgi:DNA-binding transcriptional ArsR family regulator
VPDVFLALSDPFRRKLLERLLAESGQTVRTLNTGVHISRQGIAKHLKVLESAGLVTVKRLGKEKLYFIATGPLLALSDGWLARFRPGENAAVPVEQPKAKAKSPARSRKRKDLRPNHLSRWQRTMKIMDRLEEEQAERFRRDRERE